MNTQQFIEFLAGGGKALLLPRSQGVELMGLSAEKTSSFGGSLDVPDWKECRGLSASDLRLRSDSAEMSLLKVVPPAMGQAQSTQIAAGGMLGRFTNGRGVAIVMQLTPDQLNSDEKTYLRYSSWRVTRTLSQLLANLGGRFNSDRKILDAGQKRRRFDPIPVAGAWKLQGDQEDLGTKDSWASADYDDGKWRYIKLPGMLKALGEQWVDYSGPTWFRKNVMIPRTWTGKDLRLDLGVIEIEAELIPEIDLKADVT